MTYQDIIKRGLEKGIEDIEIYATTSEGTDIELFDGELSSNNTTKYFSMNIRGIVDGKMAYVVTESVDETVIDELLDTLIVNAKNLTSTEQEFMYDGNATYREVKPLKANYAEHTFKEKVDLIKEVADKVLKSDDRIKKISTCGYSEESVKTNIVNSKGVNLSREQSYITAVVGALAVQGDDNSDGYTYKVKTDFTKFDKDKMVNEVVKKATQQLGAGSVKSGTYPVVLDKEVTTSILSAFSSMFSGESAMHKTSILIDKIGEKIVGENVTICDDPFFDGALVNTPFDDEGVPCQTKTIVENGVFKGFIHSLKTAHFFNVEPTGNGFLAGGSVSPHMTNLYLKPGTVSKDDIIATVEDGVYITDVTGLHAGLNPISGDFNVQSSGFLIKNGKIDAPITLFVLSGNFLEMLNNVEIIGNDLEEEFLSTAAPTIKVKSFQISGK